MKKYISRIIKFLLLAGLIFFILTNITFRRNIDINTYGVLTKLNSENDYEVRNVRIQGTFLRRVSVHGFRGRGFRGTFYIEGFEYIWPDYVVRSNYPVSFNQHRAGEYVWLHSFIQLIPGGPVHSHSYGVMRFSSSMQVFAVRLLEKNNAGVRAWSWSSEGGLIFVAPAEDLQSAMEIYKSFFGE